MIDIRKKITTSSLSRRMVLGWVVSEALGPSIGDLSCWVPGPNKVWKPNLKEGYLRAVEGVPKERWEGGKGRRVAGARRENDVEEVVMLGGYKVLGCFYHFLATKRTWEVCLACFAAFSRSLLSRHLGSSIMMKKVSTVYHIK